VRADYVGRGKVGDVPAARKQAGLAGGFPRSDPLLVEFATDLKTAGGSEKVIHNKVHYSSFIRKRFMS